MPVKIDAFHMMIVSKYFPSIEDLINLEFVCSKFQGNMEKFHFNPFSLTPKTRKYFPHLQTIFLYTPDDEIFDDDEVAQRSCQYLINYTTSLSKRNVKVLYPRIEFNSKDAVFNTAIPTCVVSIKSHCFKRLSLNEIDIPERVSSIGEHAFEDCKYLKEITFPLCVVQMQESAFEGCLSLTSIILPKALRTIGYKAFYNCSKLKNVDFGENLVEIQSFAFRGCLSLKDVNLPETIETVDTEAFLACINLKTIKIPDNVTTITLRNNIKSALKRALKMY
ncbi:hypothetical protein EIN_517370 [Entamoeba invadens IP1]|uniref:Leucine rich repeat containing protein BspA family protein n=1 Tax=Entamoeba invadens IP1 TaxID=370355 RepID=L7FL81_ENTIV|nr:hypothetical protein EIN_517370 [Entamoeba invadens IP1]ELP86811.1 hypothetical protein EIN_517370 [Entamoeba invadens IP1]|eukprot:XP_004253582.1 hypothetical protein EIN_517370 [Entamoeba invadens IP1]